MKKLIVLGGVVAMLCLAATQEADAFGCRRSCHEATPMCVVYVDRVVTCYKPIWTDEKVVHKVTRIVCREVVTKEKRTHLEPKYYDEKQVHTYLVQVPRVIEREVVCCRMVRVQMVDPCTGCTYICRRPETVMERVKCTVYECREEKRDVVVRVCKMEPVVRDVEVRRIVRECVPDTITTVRRVCTMVPHQVTVRVAMCVPCCDIPAMPPAK